MKSTLLNYTQIENKIIRLAHQIHENNFDVKTLILIGLNERGSVLAKRIEAILRPIFIGKLVLTAMSSKKNNSKEIEVSSNGLDSLVKDKVVILFDDVVDSGQTLMYAATHIITYYPKKLQTLALIDRNHRNFPIKVDYIGLQVATTLHEHVAVIFDEKEAANTCAYLQ
jgi:pyrimidine operon attenuation protein / uracil phosphoribosyltransferase